MQPLMYHPNKNYELTDYYCCSARRLSESQTKFNHCIILLCGDVSLTVFTMDGFLNGLSGYRPRALLKPLAP